MSEDRIDDIEDSAADIWEGLTPKQRAFLVAYSVTGTAVAAAEASGVSRRSHNLWLENTERWPAYIEAFKAANDIFGERLENETYRRAVSGVQRVRIHAGKVVCDEKGNPIVELEYSDRLLELLLAGRMPDKYGKRHHKIEHSGPNDGPIPVTFQDALDKAYGAEEG